MSGFDTSMVYHDDASPTMKTYNSYICTSRDGYLVPKMDRTLKRDKYHYPWNTSREEYIDSKPRHISKLRNILSETISNITKAQNLKRGESVELTLEIELMKDESNTPTNSLVEVTIIQHTPVENNPDSSDNILEDKTKCEIGSNSCASECASQKRRNWFERVIKRYYCKSPKDKLAGGLNLRVSNIHIPGITGNYDMKTPRKNFINILPEEITMDGDYSKGYRRVSLSKEASRDCSPQQKQPLVKRLSEIFLPLKKPNKSSKAIQPAVRDLKNKTDHMKLVANNNNKNIKKRKIAPVPKLGKLVNDILEDVIENCNEPGFNDKDTVPINYHSFYEPVVRNKNKKDKIYTIHTINNTNVGHSRSVTCIPTSILGPVIKSSCSMSDCRQISSFASKQITQFKGLGDSTQTSSKKKYKREKNYKRNYQNRNEKGDAKKYSHHKLGNKYFKKPKKSKSLHSKYSEIQWNGQTYEVNKDVKLRIEKLIVNELQNLALKEGMECDVSPLPSTENSVNNFEAMSKISSFICELDISDTQFKKSKSQKHKKVKTNKNYTIENKKSSNISKNIHKQNDQDLKLVDSMTTAATSIPKQAFEKRFKIPNTEIAMTKLANDCYSENNKNNNGKTEPPKNTEVAEDGIEIKYLNTNMKNWSAESEIVILNSKEVKPESHINHNENYSTNYDLCGLNFQHLSSGFVKRIESTDSTWNDYTSSEVVTRNQCSSTLNIVSKQLIQNVDSNGTTVINNSATSNECESNIQIELDLKDLETIINEAKHKQDSGKVVINATCKRDVKKHTQSIEFTGKNCPSYTDHLLTKAAKKLEKYRKAKL